MFKTKLNKQALIRDRKEEQSFKTPKVLEKRSWRRFFIAIPFKNTEGSEKKFLLDEEFINVIEQEYATKYLEAIGAVAS